MHAILGMPLDSRMKLPVALHVDEKRARLLESATPQHSFLQLKVTSKASRIMSLKSIKTGRCRWEDVLVLPKSQTER